MSVIRTRWLILTLFITLLLAGCRCDNSVIPTFFGIADSPADGEVTSLNPSFDWHGSESCEPDEYILHVEEDSKTGSAPIHTNIAEAALPYNYPGSGFLPGRSYIWKLTAINGATDTDPYVFGPETEVGQFFTGPVCSGETLIAPDLDDPEPAGWLEHEYVFKWIYTGGCLPTSYEVQFARDAAFTDIYLTASTSDPYVQELLMAFPDCSSLFWRVRAYDGSTYGPWSDARDFHYIISSGCHQWHYLSEDFAWINVGLNKDYCDQTGYIAAWTATLNPGCMVDGMIIVGDGTSYSSSLKDFVVDLGSGPCPSTGLDQKTAGYLATFGVITPGTYCVTVSRDQTADNYGPISLMDGIWTDPRTSSILVEETVTFGPGVGDEIVRFVWDEIDRTFLIYPLELTYACKIGPEKLCPTYDFAMEGEAIPIFARDTDTEWKLTELNGVPCYVFLPSAAMDEKLAELGGSLMTTELEFFPQPDPCATPEPETRQKTCWDYNNRTSCENAGCTWYQVNDNTSLCIPPQ